VSDAAYIDIYKEVNTAIEEQGVLGQKLNTKREKELLRRALLTATNRLDGVFTSIPRPWQDRCMTAIT